jgi:hypothetical protein
MNAPPIKEEISTNKTLYAVLGGGNECVAKIGRLEKIKAEWLNPISFHVT